jgi:SAM-dependent methyltransferase
MIVLLSQDIIELRLEVINRWLQRKRGKMRQSIKDFVSIVSRTLPIDEPIYEFGSLQVSGQEGLADLRPLFPGKKFVGTDMRCGIGVDQILDLHKIDLPAEYVGTAICMDTIEHVEYPHKALEEIYRVLKPNGIAIISSCMDFAIHDYPYDYWRFTPEAFRSLLKPFADLFVGYVGRDNFPHTIVGIGFKGNVPNLSQFSTNFDKWKNKQKYDFKRIIKNLTPPIFHHILAQIANRM